MSKYNWRTHEWKVGDRCVVRRKGITPSKGTVSYVAPNSLGVQFEIPATSYYHPAEVIPLRKKAKAALREYTGRWMTARSAATAQFDMVFVPGHEVFAKVGDESTLREVRAGKGEKP